MKIRMLSKVSRWANTVMVSEFSALEQAFHNALQGSAAKGFFDDIYYPLKIPTSSGMPDEYTYTNIGYTPAQVAGIYEMYYGGNYLIEPLKQHSGEFMPYQTATEALGRRIMAVLNMNKAKYLQLIELAGFAYNPIWNVDGEEIYSSLENQGTTDKSTSTEIDRIDYASVNSVQQVDRNTFEGGAAQPAETVTNTSDPALDSSGNPTKNYSRSRADPAHNVTTEEYTHNNADNNGSDYTVAAADTAFGQAATGGDHYHTDKRIRRGNIGVTASQDLIEKQRQVLNYSILMQFFEDINKQILVGLYDF